MKQITKPTYMSGLPADELAGALVLRPQPVVQRPEVLEQAVRRHRALRRQRLHRVRPGPGGAHFQHVTEKNI